MVWGVGMLPAITLPLRPSATGATLNDIAAQLREQHAQLVSLRGTVTRLETVMKARATLQQDMRAALERIDNLDVSQSWKRLVDELLFEFEHADAEIGKLSEILNEKTRELENARVTADVTVGELVDSRASGRDVEADNELAALLRRYDALLAENGRLEQAVAVSDQQNADVRAQLERLERLERKRADADAASGSLLRREEFRGYLARPSFAKRRRLFESEDLNDPDEIYDDDEDTPVIDQLEARVRELEAALSASRAETAKSEKIFRALRDAAPTVFADAR